MSLVAPKGRKHLSADALFQLVRTGFANLPDHRSAEAELPFTDALMSAFARCSLKSPSRLAFDRHRADGNLGTVYSIGCVPGDTPMRERLDPVAPESLRPVFKSVFRPWQRGNALEPMAFLEGHDLLALDGTGDVSSKTIHCAACLHKVHRNGTITDSPQLLGAAIIHPDVREVIPLMPEAMVKHEATTQNDCARQAAKRFVTKLRQDHPHLQFSITADRLSSHAPHIQTLQDHHLPYILGVKEGDHALLCKQVQAAAHTGHVTDDARHDRAAGLVHRVRFVNQVPRNASHADVRVKCMEYWEIGADQVQHFSWVTDLWVNKRTVVHVMRGGRARWKIANETFNTLKHQGYNFEHHDGHGTTNRSVMFAIVMMLAFLVDQTQPLCCALFHAVWAKMGSTRHLWERMRSLFYDYRLDSMRALFEALLYGLEKPRPLLTLDSSETPSVALICLLANLTSPYRCGLRMSRSRDAPMLIAISCLVGSRFDRRKTDMEDQTATDRFVDIARRGCRAMSGNCCRLHEISKLSRQQ